MSRRPKHPFPSPNGLVPARLRSQLESARLELRALYRALDRLFVAQDLPPELHRLQELDADFAEGLWVLDQPAERFDLAAMTRDTLASLNRMPTAREEFLGTLDEATRTLVEDRARALRARLRPGDAYLEIPGRDPAVR